MSEVVTTLITAVASGGAAGALIVWLGSAWISKRITASIEHSYNLKLETHRAGLEEKIEIHKSTVRDSELMRQHRWDLKRSACLDALNLIDRFFANLNWGDSAAPESQSKADIETVRKCCNALAVSCDSPTVLKEFKQCLGLGPQKPLRADMIVDLRNAIRRELGFGEDLDKDRAGAWVARVNAPRQLP